MDFTLKYVKFVEDYSGERCCKWAEPIGVYSEYDQNIPPEGKGIYHHTLALPESSDNKWYLCFARVSVMCNSRIENPVVLSKETTKKFIILHFSEIFSYDGDYIQIYNLSFNEDKFAITHNFDICKSNKVTKIVECQTFGKSIEDLVRDGNLKEFIDSLPIKSLKKLHSVLFSKKSSEREESSDSE